MSTNAISDTATIREASDPAESQLAALVEQAISELGYGTLRHVRVSATGRRIILKGRVPNYFSKQLAQTAAMTVRGVQSIQNDVAVH